MFIEKPIQIAFALAVIATVTAATGAQPRNPAEPKVIELTQVPCQFIESEGGINRGYSTARKADCEAINARSAPERIAASKPIELPPGKYIFRVSNQGVPYELGFWLRAANLVQRATLPSMSGGGLSPGKTQDYAIDLVPGSMCTRARSTPRRTTS